MIYYILKKFITELICQNIDQFQGGIGGGGGGILGGGRGGSGLLLLTGSGRFCRELDNDFSNGLGGSFGVVLVFGGSDGGMCLTGGDGWTVFTRCFIGCSFWGLVFTILEGWGPEHGTVE